MDSCSSKLWSLHRSWPPSARCGARGRARRVFGTLALTLIFGAGPLIKWRRAARAPRAVVAATVAIVATAVGARALLWLAMSPLIGRALDAPLALLPNALLLAGIAWLAIDSLERWRVGPPRLPLRTTSGATLFTVAIGTFLAALGAAIAPLVLRAAAAIDCRSLVVRSASFLAPPDRSDPSLRGVRSRADSRSRHLAGRGHPASAGSVATTAAHAQVHRGSQ